MAVTKILARNTGLSQAIQYVLNGDKTDHQILTAHQNCDPGREYRQMMDTKWDVGKMDGRQCYHIIQSFKPGEITPELALEIAKEFAAEYLPDYEVVIGTHIDRGHIHSHLIFNSVNAQTGENITSQRRNITVRSGPSQIGCAENMGCPSSWRANPPRQSATLSGCDNPRASPPSAPCWRQTCGQPLRTPMTWATFSCSWSIEDTRFTMAIVWVFVCGARSDSCTPAGGIRYSLRTVSMPPFWAIWKKSRPDAAPQLSLGLATNPIKSIRNTLA